MESDEVRAKLRAATDAAGSVKAWALAQNPKVSPSYVGDVLNGGREPGPTLLRALGLQRVTRYVSQEPQRFSPSTIVMDGPAEQGQDNARQSLWELDRAATDYELARWAQKWGRPALEALMGPLNKSNQHI